MKEKKSRKDSVTYVVSSNFGGKEAEINQLMIVLKQLIKSRENV